MSSSGFSPTLAIERPDCRRVRVLILCAVLLALAALAYGGLPEWGRALVALLAMGYGWREFRHASPRSPLYVTRIVITADGRILVGRARDPAALAPAALVHHWIWPGLAAGLALAPGDGQRADVILFRDSLPPETWRRLTVCLRHPGRQAS